MKVRESRRTQGRVAGGSVTHHSCGAEKPAALKVPLGVVNWQSDLAEPVQ